MLDKSIPYYRILLKRKPGTDIPYAALPEGYTFVRYEPGDEAAWADIETSVQEFEQEEDALAYIKEHYAPFTEELKRRMLFVQDESGSKVATFTAWWNYTGERRYPFMHWVAVKPEAQGKGIGKALIAHGVQHMIHVEGDVAMYIPTQTWSHKAIRLYRWAGFDFVVDEPRPGGFENQTEQGIEIIRGLL
ncbi:MAG: GNAT family N-acetyltransferase [Paenibacillus sp.]|uniref:GNAT family N-acetyltransferase n=1 Tax=Paenibacillus aquistagni TaxID=1852522 RepID=UPI000B506C55|nr:GNAT family N-acetyltransferase [Paenibacillus aquistagni]MBR2569045.1 GNAT family N-acetyltransferase [Paenibacillus sp.]